MFEEVMHSPPNPNLSAGQIIRTSQILCGAMVMGILIFMMVAMLVANGGKPMAAGKSLIIPLFAIVVGLNNFVMQYLTAGFVVKLMIKKLTPEQLGDRSPQMAGVFQVRMIIRVALLEAAAFFNLIAYMIERQWWSVAVTGFLVAIMLLNFPTMNQFDSWADDVRRSIENQF